MAKGKAPVRGSVGSSSRAHMQKTPTMKSQAATVEVLNDDEFHFLWKTLVEGGALTAGKLQTFMQTVAGVNLSAVQARDLLQYMDANGDGRVGQEDFKYFMSVGCLADTDVKLFMWEPKRKFREENPLFRELAGNPGVGDEAAGARDSIDLGQNPRRSLESAETPEDGQMSRQVSGDRHMAVVAPSQPQAKKRPQPSRMSTDVWGPKSHEAVNASAGIQRKLKPPSMTPEVERKIEQALLKYEQRCWERFLEEERNFKRRIFEQFAGKGNGELNPTDYHRMLTKWMPLANSGKLSSIKPADSLAALEFVQRRDLEDRGIVPKQIPESADAADGATNEATQSGDKASTAAVDGADPAEAKLSFALWLDVVNGKHKPEEHYPPSHFHPHHMD